MFDVTSAVAEPFVLFFAGMVVYGAILYKQRTLNDAQKRIFKRTA